MAFDEYYLAKEQFIIKNFPFDSNYPKNNQFLMKSLAKKLKKPKNEIYIKTMTGKTITIKVKSTDTISMVKSKIKKVEKIPSNQ